MLFAGSLYYFPRIMPYYLEEVKSMYRLLSHNDLDGVGCGILAKIAFGKKSTSVITQYPGLTMKLNGF